MLEGYLKWVISILKISISISILMFLAVTILGGLILDMVVYDLYLIRDYFFGPLVGFFGMFFIILNLSYFIKLCVNFF